MKYPIIFRIDDVHQKMNFDNFMRYISLFKEFNIKPLIGIIPDCKDENIFFGNVANFWDLMREFKKNGYPIAMHGVFHKYESKKKGIICLREKSEFSGIEYNIQLEKIKYGKEILEKNGIYTDVFFAPGHSYDKNTLKALNSIGFRYNSDGYSLKPYDLYNIKSIPVNGPYKIHFGRGILTICIHCDLEKKEELEKLRKFIIKKQKSIISFEEAKKIKNRHYFFCRIEEVINICINSIINILYSVLRRK